MALPPGVREIPAERLDTRTDAQILDSLTHPKPVSSEKNVWSFWDAGLEAMPVWSQRNVVSWARRLPKDWNIYVLNIVAGSALNVDNFLDKSNFYDSFNNRTIQGPNAGVWYSDITRLAALSVYGGVWVDTGIMLFRDFTADIWSELENPESRFEIAGFSSDLAPRPNNDIIASYFVAARKASPYVVRWHRVLLEIWQSGWGHEENNDKADSSFGLVQHTGTNSTSKLERRDHRGLSAHPLLSPVEPIEVRADLGAKYKVPSGPFNDYLNTYLSQKRARMTIDAAEDWNGPAWWEKHAMILPIQESYWTYISTDFNGQKQFDYLSMDMEPTTQEGWKQANALAQDLASKCCHMKLSHGLKTTKMVHVASMWESEQYENYDVKKGTFAAYLRWASVHLEQVDRHLKPFDVPTTGHKIHAGLLEVV